MRAPAGLAKAAALAALMFLPATAAAVMDLGDRGPVLNAGNFAMRVTNIGVLGNAFFDVGLSFDPSFEYPRGSGNELLRHADLWVGGIDANGDERVSGGPMLEWRPTLDPADRVRIGGLGDPGSRWMVDDDGDGKVDEEVLNGKDDDGDGRIDEDMGFPAQQVMASDYVDDRPEAVGYGYPNGEHHSPLGLSVHQEAYAWSLPGYDGIAGIHFTITNHGTRTVRELYAGLMADLDSRGPNDPTGHLNDRVTSASYATSVVEGTSRIRDASGYLFHKACITPLAGNVPVVMDGAPGSRLPVIALMPLGHTTDPLALLDRVPGLEDPPAAARAPGQVSFHTTILANDLPPGQGGLPVLDADRYAALAGHYQASSDDRPHDYAVLVSCGPFHRLGPGESINFDVALVGAAGLDSLPVALARVAAVYHGVAVNRLPDTTGTSSDHWDVGATGVNGHEACIEPPPGVSFDYDPHCGNKLYRMVPPPNCQGCLPQWDIESVHYEHGHCVWTDADCDGCTGFNGNETVVRWLDPGAVPPAPARREIALDHAVRVEWDNFPEVLLETQQNGFEFLSYRLYKLSQWTDRTSQVPPPREWRMIAEFASDTTDGETSLAAITDSSVGAVGIRDGKQLYGVGRYKFTDTEVLNGFDYLYAVTGTSERRTPISGGLARVVSLESPLTATIDSLVTPRIAARSDAMHVWVVPNPYRAHASWDRPPVPGDAFARHLDFFGLPRAKSVIKIWTVAGDLVARIDHDGSSGAGAASWNLISRNGQDVESGIYLFTVDSSLGNAIGRFVVIR